MVLCNGVLNNDDLYFFRGDDRVSASTSTNSEMTRKVERIPAREDLEKLSDTQ